jgi:hypothetical protein
VSFEQLADDHSDRVSVTTHERLARHFGVFGIGGVWVDQEDTGGDAELGIEAEEFAFAGSRMELAGFGAQGRFSTSLGGRAELGGTTSNGSWLVGYEFTYDDIQGFEDDNNTLPQHRVGASWDMNTSSRWNLSLRADVVLFDTETSWVAGFFLQRSF